MVSIFLAGLRSSRCWATSASRLHRKHLEAAALRQRRAAERGAAPQRLALHAEQRPQRPLRNDGQHGRPARHRARAHHELRGRHQLLDAALRGRRQRQQGRRGLLRLSRAVQAAGASQALRPFPRVSQRRARACSASSLPSRTRPACSNAACHAHPASVQILGVLDTNLSLDQGRRQPGAGTSHHAGLYRRRLVARRLPERTVYLDRRSQSVARARSGHRARRQGRTRRPDSRAVQRRNRRPGASRSTP